MKASQEQLRSSIAVRMPMDMADLVPDDRNVEGVVEIMLDATQRQLLLPYFTFP